MKNWRMGRRDPYEAIILRAREFVAGCQLQGDSVGAGGFGYDRIAKGPRDRPDLSNTSWTLMAMRATEKVEEQRKEGERADIDWAAAIAFVQWLQITNAASAGEIGGFGYTRGDSDGGSKKEKAVPLQGFGSMTYAGLESLFYANVDRNDPRIRSAIAWAGQHWSVDENPGMGTRGLFYYYTIMAKALRLSGSDTLPSPSGVSISWKKQLIEKLVAMQKPDGHWINENGEFWESDPALVTAYVILTLEYVIGD